MSIVARRGELIALMAPLDNTIVVLIGFAGAGKYTVGRALAARTAPDA